MNNQETHNMISGFNPFPGLRSFTIDESYLFFGREHQSDEILANVVKNKFVAVIGASGSGKSSLVYCGLVPILYGGFAQVGSDWNVISVRPGNNPIENLANALVSSLKQKNDLSTIRIIESTLRNNSLGLVEAVKSFNLSNNTLIIFDQFEELFRFKRQGDLIVSSNESFAYVNLITEAVLQTEVPIYVVITMRSDFVGECSQYRSLTTLINKSHYLVPQMTHDDLCRAIMGPIAVGGGTITQHLLNMLLNDIGDNPDHLPILQHALMRTWNYWEKHRRGNDPLDVCHYEAIGRMKSALSEHANEAYDELSSRGKEVCELLFKSLTDRGGDNIGIRRPMEIREICKVTNATLEEVEEVINIFRKPERSFLSPSEDVKITPTTIIDISHESLMRIWDRLRNWVEEEAQSAQMYIRLADASAMYQQGKISLWRPPDLQLALSWREKQHPTLAWAIRYNPAYERAMEYLATSENEFRAEEENKARLQRETIRRSHRASLVFGIALVLALGFLFFAIVKRNEAEINLVKANENMRLAEENREKVIVEKYRAEAQEREAVRQAKIATDNEIEALEQKVIAERNAHEAMYQREQAQLQKDTAEYQRRLAEENFLKARERELQADIAMRQADSAKNQTERLRMLSISQSMAIKSMQIEDDKDRKALLAYHAYLFNNEFSVNKFSNDIYNGLYSSLKEYPNETFDFDGGHTAAVRTLKINHQTNSFYSLSSDGLLLKWNLTKRNEGSVMIRIVKNNSGVMDINNAGDMLAVGCKNGVIELIQLNETSQSTVTFSMSQSAISSLTFVPNRTDDLLATSADGSIVCINCRTGEIRELKKLSQKINSIAISDDLQYLSVATDKGAYLWRIADKETFELIDLQIIGESQRMMVVAIDRISDKLAIGDEQGFVWISDINQTDEIVKLRGHKSRISCLQYNREGTILASAGFDSNICLWQTSDYNREPVILREHESWVYSIAFANSGQSLISGNENADIREWKVYSKALSERLLPHINRNMTKKEWNVYVGEDVKYQKARADLE